MQGRQEACRNKFWKKPNGHFSHCAASIEPVRYRPGAQLSHAFPYVPASHDWHMELPLLRVAVPFPHALHPCLAT